MTYSSSCIVLDGTVGNHILVVIPSPEQAQRVNDVDEINERISAFSVKINVIKITFIKACVPDKEGFYQKL